MRRVNSMEEMQSSDPPLLISSPTTPTRENTSTTHNARGESKTPSSSNNKQKVSPKKSSSSKKKNRRASAIATSGSQSDDGIFSPKSTTRRASVAMGNEEIKTPRRKKSGDLSSKTYHVLSPTTTAKDSSTRRSSPKKKLQVKSSDDDDEVFFSPSKKKNSKSHRHRRRHSDDDDFDSSSPSSSSTHSTRSAQERRAKIKQHKRGQGRRSKSDSDSVIMDIMKRLSTNVTSVDHQRLCCKLLTQVTCNNDATKDELIEAGVVPLVALAMRTHATDRQVMRYACGALTNLASRNAKVVVQTSGVDLFLTAIQTFATHDKIQIQALKGLYMLCKSGYRNDIIQQGGVACLAQVLQRYERHDRLEPLVTKVMRALEQEVVDQLFLQGQASRAIEMLIDMELSKQPQEQRRAGLEDDVDWTALCVKLVDAMEETQDNAELQSKCCRLIVDLTYGHDDCKDTLIHEGCATLITEAMTHFMDDAGLQFRACRALRNLLAANDQECREIVVEEAGGIEALLDTLQDFPTNAKIQEEACAAMCQLTTCPYNKKRHCKLILEMGGKELLEESLATFGKMNERIAKYASKALSKLEQAAAAAAV